MVARCIMCCNHKSGRKAALLYADMSEWLKEAVLKTVEGNTSVGSNPTIGAMRESALFHLLNGLGAARTQPASLSAGVAQLIERMFRTHQVMGLIPVTSSTLERGVHVLCSFLTGGPLLRPSILCWCSSVGRATDLYSVGRGFEACHQLQ